MYEKDTRWRSIEGAKTITRRARLHPFGVAPALPPWGKVVANKRVAFIFVAAEFI